MIKATPQARDGHGRSTGAQCRKLWWASERGFTSRRRMCDSNRAGQQSRGVEQGAKHGGRAWRYRWHLERVAVACSSSRLPLDESLTCTQEAKQARAPSFASCRCTTSANLNSPLAERTRAETSSVVLTRRCQLLSSADLPLLVSCLVLLFVTGIDEGCLLREITFEICFPAR